MYKFLMFICLLISLFLSTSCALSKPNDVNKAEIEQILDQMKTDFNQLDLVGIMSFYHTDFLHNGTALGGKQVEWQNRMALYSSFDFTNLNYDINDDLATVSGTSKWITATETLVNEEPADNGDFSYFIKENGVWKIYGNHHPVVSLTSVGK